MGCHSIYFHICCLSIHLFVLHYGGVLADTPDCLAHTFRERGTNLSVRLVWQSLLCLFGCHTHVQPTHSQFSDQPNWKSLHINQFSIQPFTHHDWFNLIQLDSTIQKCTWIGSTIPSPHQDRFNLIQPCSNTNSDVWNPLGKSFPIVSIYVDDKEGCSNDAYLVVLAFCAKDFLF